MARKTVIICDDQKRFIDQFVERHKDHYEIITLNDSRDVLKTIERQKSLPDIILLDLYHPRDVDTNFEQKRQLAEKELTNLDEQIKKTAQAVNEAWEPLGIEILKLLREKYTAHELPIAIFTQKGLLLLDDDRIRQVEQNDAHWLLKKKLSARTEAIRIERIIAQNTNIPKELTKKATKVYRWIIGFSWLIIGILGTRMFLNEDAWTDIVAAIVIGIITALVSYLATSLLQGVSTDKEETTKSSR